VFGHLQPRPQRGYKCPAVKKFPSEAKPAGILSSVACTLLVAPFCRVLDPDRASCCLQDLLAEPPWLSNGGSTNYTFRTSRKECGQWQQDYAELHRQILGGEKPSRYAMVYCTRGMADCLKGAVTIFYFALFTSRAFQVQ
jgi:hypothetical protein